MGKPGIGKHSSECIREELARILGSGEFKATPRRREMLRYLVEEMLAGRGRELKGYSIGVSVFGRPEGFDPQSDPIVRLEARRLRRDLDGYYVSAGRANPLRISIPTGHYIPETVEPKSTPPSGIENSHPTEPDGLQVEENESATAGHTTKTTIISSRSRLAVAIALSTLIVVGLIGYGVLLQTRPTPQVKASDQMPAIMILPFEALSANHSETLIATGVVHQIVADLIRFPDLRIYSPPASSSGVTIDATAEGRRLGVSHLVSGDVSSDTKSLRISARLVDIESGRILWSESYTRRIDAGELLAAESHIASGIASTLGQSYGILRREITSHLTDEFKPSMSSYECVLRAYDYRKNFAAKLRKPIIACLNESVQRDPNYGEAWAMLGWLYLDSARFQPNNSKKQADFDRALDAASHAQSIDAKNVMALKALSSINHYMGNLKQGEHYAREALTLNPNDPDSLAQLGWRLAVRGNFKEGIPLLKKAVARSISPPGWYFHLIAIDDYMHGRYPEMLAAAKNGIIDNLPTSVMLSAIAYGALDNRQAARKALTLLEKISPSIARDPAGFLRGHQATEEIVNALMAGLHKAGWTEPDSAGL